MFSVRRPLDLLLLQSCDYDYWNSAFCLWASRATRAFEKTVHAEVVVDGPADPDPVAGGANLEDPMEVADV